MDWYYATDGRRHGPVSEARLGELLRAGDINHETWVWRAGFANWRPLESALPQMLQPAASDKPCSECRKFFPQSEMICLNRAWVCASCKPLFLQRMSEGVAPPLGIGELWRKGHLLIFHSETEFPDRCIRCNAPANGYRLKAQLYWAPSWRIVLSHTRAVIHVGLCKRHRSLRQGGVIAALLVILAGIVVMAVGGRFAPGGLLLIFVGLVATSGVTSMLKAQRIADGVIWLRGAGKAFLAELPEWTEHR